MKTLSLFLLIVFLCPYLLASKGSQCGKLFLGITPIEFIDKNLFSFIHPTHYTYNKKRTYDDYHAEANLLDNMILHFALMLKDSEGRSILSGRDFIEHVATDIYPEAPYLEGYWLGTSRQSHNYKQYYQARQEGLSEAEAAFKTHTGSVAKSLGFDSAYKVHEMRSSDPAMSYVHFYFYKKAVAKDMAIVQQVKDQVKRGDQVIKVHYTKKDHPETIRQIHWLANSLGSSVKQAVLSTVVGQQFMKVIKKNGYIYASMSANDMGKDTESYLLTFRKDP